MAVINGSDLMLFKGNKSIAFATSHSLSISADTFETSSKDDVGSWTSKTVRKLSWTCSTDNLFSAAAYNELYTAMTARQPFNLILSTKGTQASDGSWSVGSNGVEYSGNVVITSLELNAPDADNATFSCSFEGVGALVEI